MIRMVSMVIIIAADFIVAVKRRCVVARNHIVVTSHVANKRIVVVTVADTAGDLGVTIILAIEVEEEEADLTGGTWSDHFSFHALLNIMPFL